MPGSAVDLVKRRRKCLRCSEPFYTYERRADDPEEWLGVLEEEKTARRKPNAGWANSSCAPMRWPWRQGQHRRATAEAVESPGG